MTSYPFLDGAGLGGRLLIERELRVDPGMINRRSFVNSRQRDPDD